MRTTAELDLLEQIYTEMQELKRRMENNQNYNSHMQTRLTSSPR